MACGVILKAIAVICQKVGGLSGVQGASNIDDRDHVQEASTPFAAKSLIYLIRAQA